MYHGVVRELYICMHMVMTWDVVTWDVVTRSNQFLTACAMAVMEFLLTTPFKQSQVQTLNRMDVQLARFMPRQCVHYKHLAYEYILLHRTAWSQASLNCVYSMSTSNYKVYHTHSAHSSVYLELEKQQESNCSMQLLLQPCGKLKPVTPVNHPSWSLQVIAPAGHSSWSLQPFTPMVTPVNRPSWSLHSVVAPMQLSHFQGQWWCLT